MPSEVQVLVLLPVPGIEDTTGWLPRLLNTQGCALQLAAMSAEEFGRLQHEYVVAFAEHLLLRTAPLHTLTPEDDRLVSSPNG
jgi:hypothetical protein